MTELTVEIQKLITAEQEIQQAVESYRGAVDRARTAADALVANWSGDAREAFAAEQEKAYNWHMSIVDIVLAFTAALKQTAEKYQEAEETVKSTIGSR